jgi:superfamily I DNA/RNA helicase
VPVRHGSADDLGPVLDAWLAAHSALSEQAEGVACVISTAEPPDVTVRASAFPIDSARIRWLTPELAKGLEFDLVVLIDPDSFGTGIEGAVDRYVAMTRATQQLVILTSEAAQGSERARG